MTPLDFGDFATYYGMGLCAGFILAFGAWVVRRVFITAFKFF